MRKFIIFLLAISAIQLSFATNGGPTDKEGSPQDTLKAYFLDEFVITSSVKETNLLKNMPSAVSVLSPKQLANSRIQSLPELSSVIPNFFIPSYGSRVSTPIYIRGIGARSGAQTVSLYVDNIPNFNPSAFDFEFQDIQRVEILRGAQGTLYGRNAIGGIVNIYTLSPLTHQGTSFMVEGGRYGHFGASVSHYNKLSDKFGVSAGAYYKRNDGYFKNSFTNKRIDGTKNAGGKIKMEWEITPSFKALYSANFDHFIQNGFPYMHADSTTATANDPSSYKRNLFTNGLTLNYKGDGFSLNSTTGYQLLDDKMVMDQDYTEKSVFTITQMQKQRSLSQEFTIKSESSSNYKWVYGLFGFIDNRTIDTPVSIKEDGVTALADLINSHIPPSPMAPKLEFTSNRIELPGVYKKPVSGLAFFHQSTLDNLFGLDGLSATAGIRFDYEKTKIDFNTYSEGGEIQVKMGENIIGKQSIDTSLEGVFDKDFWQVLPKVALQYNFSPTSMIYVSASKGYKSGGYNEQAFSKILQDAMMNSRPGAPEKEDNLEEQLSYDPETSWAYELGGRYEMFERRLSLNYTLFYSNVNNIQIIKLQDQGTSGRTVDNAGKSTSKGVELSVRYNPTTNFTLFSEYGFASAKFKNYTSEMKVGRNTLPVNYSGNYIPFAPQHTLSVGASYVFNFGQNAFINRMVTNVQYTGAGKIYWTEDNGKIFEVNDEGKTEWTGEYNEGYSQPFYGLTNASVSLHHGPLSLELWGKNIFAKDYISFYFRASDMTGVENPYVQRGTPARFGATLKYTL